MSFTAEYLEKELLAAEQSLATTHDTIQTVSDRELEQAEEHKEQHPEVAQLHAENATDKILDDDTTNDATNDASNETSKNTGKDDIYTQRFSHLSKAERLLMLQREAGELVFAREVTVWAQSITEDTISDPISQAQICCDLGDLLIRSHQDQQSHHQQQQQQQQQQQLLQTKYMPLHQHVHNALVVILRTDLAAAGYPSTTACRTLLKHCKQRNRFWELCRSISNLHSNHNLLLHHMTHGQDVPLRRLDIVTELVRPLVTKIRFHFVDQHPDRITTQRIERLPEWLLAYVKDNFMESPVWRLVFSGVGTLDADIPVAFVNEIVRAIEWVLSQRRFFHHPLVAGPNSNPIFLMNAIEHTFAFDQYLNEKLAKSRIDITSVPSLVDTLIRQNESLYTWWIDREKESVFSKLFDDTPVIKPLANRVAPRAEVFCALIRSIQHKASKISAPALYMSRVAVPLCNQFVDLIQDTSSELRNLMCYQKRAALDGRHLVANLNEWAELINGTHLACVVLAKDQSWQDVASSTKQSDHDLARFGKSLERLQLVLVQDFASSFVEVLLMEKAKFASYLMLAAHMLASQEWEAEEADISPELREASSVIHNFHMVCKASDAGIEDTDVGEETDIAQFASIAMYEHVMNDLAEKVLAVALDVDNVTPDVWFRGAETFARDVHTLMAGCQLPLVLRLLDVCTLLSAHPDWVSGIKQALEGLTVHGSQYSQLDLADFESDSNLFEEASSMIKAKGLPFIQLGDALSILNRRRDI